MGLMILKLINGFHLQTGLLYTNERLNHHSFLRQRDQVCLFEKYFFFTYYDIVFVSIGDASNFDDYDEEPRKKHNEVLELMLFIIKSSILF